MKPLADALRLLSRRPLTVHEMRERLAERGHAPAQVDATLADLESSGELDDLKLARHWVTVRAARLARGPARLLRELEERGVDPDLARKAWKEAVASGDVDPEALLAAEAGKRVSLAGGMLDDRRYARVYNALLRAGFEPEAVRAALEPHRRDPAESPPDITDESDHEFP
jgi:regulatory protein